MAFPRTYALQIDTFTDGDLTANPAWTSYDDSSMSLSVVSERLRCSGTILIGTSKIGAYTSETRIDGEWQCTFRQVASDHTSFGMEIKIMNGTPTTVGQEANSYSGQITSGSGMELYEGTNRIANDASPTVNIFDGSEHTIKLQRKLDGTITLTIDATDTITTTDTTLNSFTNFSVGCLGSGGGINSTHTVDFGNVYFTPSVMGTLIDDFFDGDLTGWTEYDVDDASWSAATKRARLTADGIGTVSNGGLYIANSNNNGIWQFKYKQVAGNTGAANLYIKLCGNAPTQYDEEANCYTFKSDKQSGPSGGLMSIYNGTTSMISQTNISINIRDGNDHTLKIFRYLNGYLAFSIDDTDIVETADSSITTFTHFSIAFRAGNAGAAQIDEFDEVYYSIEPFEKKLTLDMNVTSTKPITLEI